MPKRITIVPHLSLEELEQRYRQAKEPVERSDYQIIWLLASGRRSEEVAAITGYSQSWIYELVWGYNRIGPKSLGDGRVDNSGAAPLLDDVQQANQGAGIERTRTRWRTLEWAESSGLSERVNRAVD